jgi:uncharacterized protein (DUF2062 family)
MRKLFRKFLPHHDTVKSQRWLRPFSGWLHHPNLWQLHRRSVAGGVAVGLFCGLIPGPLQMICAMLLAILFRVNLPVAAFTTFYTNPFTILPLYMVAYQTGAWVSGAGSSAASVQISLPEIHWDNWDSALWGWFTAMGKPILVGLPLLAIILSIAGYFTVRIAWRLAVVWKWQARKKRRHSMH